MTKRGRKEADKVKALFYGTLLGRKVEPRTNRVPGLGQFFAQLTEEQLRQCQRYADAVCAKINRGRSQAECIGAGVKALKLQLGITPGIPLTSEQTNLLDEFEWERIPPEKAPSIDG